MASSTLIKFFLCLLAGTASAIPLETYQGFITTGPRSDAQRVGNAAILARGTGTRDFYFLEVNPVTGALPVTLTPGIPANASVAPNGGPIATSSTLIAGNNAGIQQPIATDFGIASEALRTASMVGNLSGLADFNTGLTSAQTLRIVPSDDSTIAVENFPNPVDAGSGASSSNTLRVIPSSDATIGVQNFPNPVDTAYGITSPNTIRTAAQIGNTTGGAAFNAGVTTAQTLRVVLPTDQTAIPVTGTFSLTYDTNYGTVGASTLRTASQIGNATGAADFDTGVSTAQTLRIMPAADASLSAENFPTVVDTGTGNSTASTIRTMPASDASISAENFPTVVDTGVGNSTASTIRTMPASDASLSAENFPTVVDTGTGVSTASTIRTMPAADASLSAENFPTTVDTNYGTVGGQTIRTASQIGNATGAAAFGTGTSNAQTLRVVLPNDQPAVSVVQGTSPWVTSTSTTAISFTTTSANTTCSGLTGTYATLLVLPANGCIFHVFNGCNGSWVLSVNTGASDYMELESGQSVSIDFCANGKHVPSGNIIQAKDGTTPPTTGNLRVSVAG